MKFPFFSASYLILLEWSNGCIDVDIHTCSKDNVQCNTVFDTTQYYVYFSITITLKYGK